MDKTGKIFLVIGAIIVVLGLAAFSSVAFLKFGSKDGDRGFGMMKGRGAGMMERRGFGDERFGRGELSGQVTAVSSNTITVKNSDDDEVSVAIADTTSIYNQDKIAKASDIAVNNSVEVIGRPNSSGVVQATIIIIK